MEEGVCRLVVFHNDLITRKDSRSHIAVTLLILLVGVRPVNLTAITVIYKQRSAFRDVELGKNHRKHVCSGGAERQAPEAASVSHHVGTTAVVEVVIHVVGVPHTHRGSLFCPSILCQQLVGIHGRQIYLVNVHGNIAVIEAVGLHSHFILSKCGKHGKCHAYESKKSLFHIVCCFKGCKNIKKNCTFAR